MPDKELERLNKKAAKLLKKREETGIYLSDVTLSVISRIAQATTINDVPWIAIQALERVCSENKII